MHADFIAALPFLFLSLTVGVLTLAISIRRGHGMAASAAFLGLAVALVSTLPSLHAGMQPLTPLFRSDHYVTGFVALILGSSMAILAFAYSYFRSSRFDRIEEFYLLLVIATLGAAMLVASADLLAFFLSLETLSVALIGMIAYSRWRMQPLEAGLKYLVLSGISSAFILFGIGLVFLNSGSLAFNRIQSVGAHSGNALWLVGTALAGTGVGFKLSLVPFHMWAPDVFEGAPAPAAAYLATVSKIAVFALVMRYYFLLGGDNNRSIVQAITVVAVLSMLIGNLLALLQENVKRVLAYSSIAHLGYLLVTLLAPGALARSAAEFYLVMYAVTTIGAFGVIGILSDPDAEHDSDTIERLRGLFWSRPWLAGSFTLILLSLAGIPPTIGFIGKMFIMESGIGAELSSPIIALIIGSIIGLYYYLRLVVVMFLTPVTQMAGSPELGGAIGGGAVLLVLTAAVIWLGVYPEPLVVLIGWTASHLVAVSPGGT